jgi:hypothetical protein
LRDVKPVLNVSNDGRLDVVKKLEEEKKQLRL